MLRKAQRLGYQVQSVDELTDEELVIALKTTHEYLQEHSAYARKHRIYRGCGPADASERTTEKAHYVGTPARYRFYD